MKKDEDSLSDPSTLSRFRKLLLDDPVADIGVVSTCIVPLAGITGITVYLGQANCCLKYPDQYRVSTLLKVYQLAIRFLDQHV